MKVRLKRSWSKVYPELTVGNVYRVLGLEGVSLRIISDAGEPILFNPKGFEYVDSQRPANWIAKHDEDGELQHAYPPELLDPPYFFEEFFDYNMRVRQKFHGYVHVLCHDESTSLPDPPNTYIRVEWKHESPDAPITLYSELDEERCEVRKVELFRDGRVTNADGKGSTGTTQLGDQPVASVAEIAANPELAVREIDRAEFEAAWNQALDLENL